MCRYFRLIVFAKGNETDFDDLPPTAFVLAAYFPGRDCLSHRQSVARLPLSSTDQPAGYSRQAIRAAARLAYSVENVSELTISL